VDRSLAHRPSVFVVFGSSLEVLPQPLTDAAEVAFAFGGLSDGRVIGSGDVFA
jgi:hypothetical protein